LKKESTGKKRLTGKKKPKKKTKEKSQGLSGERFGSTLRGESAVQKVSKNCCAKEERG